MVFCTVANKRCERLRNLKNVFFFAFLNEWNKRDLECDGENESLSVRVNVEGWMLIESVERITVHDEKK